MGKKTSGIKRLLPHDPDSDRAATSIAYREICILVLWCIGILTMLALISYRPADVSLNASGSTAVHNWIGPKGAYWADFLLQGFGIGAYAIGPALLIAGWRVFFYRPIVRGYRRAIGLTLLFVFGGTLAELASGQAIRAYPPGGLIGAVLSRVFIEQLAWVGAFILTLSLVLVAIALTAEGVLIELGSHGHQAATHAASRSQRWMFDGLTVWLSRYRARRAEAKAAKAQRAVNDKNARAKASAPEPKAPTSKAPPPPVYDAVVEVEAEPTEQPVEPVVTRAAAATDDLISDAVLVDEMDGDLPEPKVAPVGRRSAKATVPSTDSAHLAESSEAEVASSSSSSSSDETEPMIVDVRPQIDVAQIERPVVQSDDSLGVKDFELPSTSLLDFEVSVRATIDPQVLKDNAVRLTQTLKNYGIEGHVREIRPGPVVTMYEYVPGPGIKLSRIAGLADDLAMSMEALRVRIVAPIPGKGAVGIEIPNDTRETVYLKELFAHEAFQAARSKLTLALGKDIEGNPYVANLAKMPHLLVAGATGAGKSVSINSMIMSILFKATPAEVRMLMVDPKMLELSVYEGIPHLLLPVVTDPKKAATALKWAVSEMERRYQLLSEVGVRSIDGFNKKVDAMAEEGRKLVLPPLQEADDERVCEHMPYIIVIVDELADLMMVASRDVETSIMRLAQMARAAGIHLILATQRPSVDVITGVIKANFPTRIAFQVASRHDSRTIIDGNGAENLLGRGDMLYMSPGAGGLIRVHGAYVSEEEIERSVGFLKQQGKPQYDESILQVADDAGSSDVAPEDQDEFYDQAVSIVAETRQASISMIQRRLRIGYNRAARMVERMESEGIVGPADGAKPREVYVSATFP